MERYKKEMCFVCNTLVLDQGVLLSSETTTYSKTPFPTKLMHLLGDDFMVVILEDDKVCLRCVNLINRTDKLEQELRKTQRVIRGFLNEKYELNYDDLEFPTPSEEVQDSEYDYIYDEDCLSDSQNVIDNFIHDDGCKTNSAVGHEDHSDRIAAEVVIKSEPVSNNDENIQSYDSYVSGTSSLLTKFPDDDITSTGNQSPPSYSWDEINPMGEGPQNLNLKVEKEILSSDYKDRDGQTLIAHPDTESIVRNETSEQSMTDFTGKDQHLNENNSVGKSFCAVSDCIVLLKDVLRNSTIGVELAKTNTEEVSNVESPKTASGKKFSGRRRNEQVVNKCKRKERAKKQTNAVRKQRPILPKVSNIKEVISSLYIIQNSDPGSSNENSKRKEQQKFDVAIKTEVSDTQSFNEITPLVASESSLNESTLVEAAQLNLSRTENPLESNLNTQGADIKPKAIKKEKTQVNYKCQFCPKTIKNKVRLRYHEASHTGNYSHYCETCGHGFSTLHQLSCHRRIHSQEERFMCDVCGKKFKHSGSLWIHRKWHDNPYPYKCEICGKPYRHSSGLAIHRRKHNGERMFKCSYCPLTFDLKPTLVRHLYLHTKQFPFNCEMCDKGFTTRAKYTRHLERKHNMFVEKTPVDPRDYKMAVVYNDVSEKTDDLDSESAEKGDVNESNSNSQIEFSENSDLIFYNSPDNCQIEITLPPPSEMSDNTFTNISWLS